MVNLHEIVSDGNLKQIEATVVSAYCVAVFLISTLNKYIANIVITLE